MNKELAAAIAEHKELTQWLTVAKERELQLRQFIAVRLFPKPKEGTNRYTAPGIEAVVGHKLHRKINQVELEKLAPALLKARFPLDRLVSYKPELMLRAYHQLDDRQRHTFDRVLVITPATPTLVIT